MQYIDAFLAHNVMFLAVVWLVLERWAGGKGASLMCAVQKIMGTNHRCGAQSSQYILRCARNMALVQVKTQHRKGCNAHRTLYSLCMLGIATVRDALLAAADRKFKKSRKLCDLGSRQTVSECLLTSPVKPRHRSLRHNFQPTAAMDRCASSLLLAPRPQRRYNTLEARTRTGLVRPSSFSGGNDIELSATPWRMLSTTIF